MHLHSCSSIIYNREDIETKYPLTDKWMKGVVSIYSGILSKMKSWPFEIIWIDPVKLVKKNQI